MASTEGYELREVWLYLQNELKNMENDQDLTELLNFY